MNSTLNIRSRWHIRPWLSSEALSDTCLALLFLALTVIRTIHPGTTVLDKIVNAILVLISFKAVAWWLINNIWPVLAKYTKEEFGRDFHKLTPVQKVLIVGGFYVLLIYALIATLGAMG
jgi:hypothetical protein